LRLWNKALLNVRPWRNERIGNNAWTIAAPAYRAAAASMKMLATSRKAEKPSRAERPKRCWRNCGAV
jgi:hypothetical protein